MRHAYTTGKQKWESGYILLEQESTTWFGFFPKLWLVSLKRLVAGFPLRRPGFKSGSSHVGFVVDKVALGQVFSEYFSFPCQSSFHQFLQIHHHYHPGLVQ
jgi:hypothetical protein